MEINRVVSRRQLMRLAGLSGMAALAAACSQASPAVPTSAPPAPTAAPAAKPTTPAEAQPAAAPAQAAPSVPSAATADWNAVVEAAKKEGSLSVATYAGTAYRKVIDDFEAAYPGVKVEHTSFQSSSRDYVPRLLQERKAGLFAWDLALMPAPEMLRQVKPAGGLSPIRPLLVHPEVVNDSYWADGFESGFLDKDKQYNYAIVRSLSQSLWIDTNQIKDGEISGFRDLLDPKWKGKILAGDPRTKGSGFNLATTLRLRTKDDSIIKQLWFEQEAVLNTDARQLTEQVARGRFPIGLGAVSLPIIQDMVTLGVGNNLKWLPMLELDYLYSGNHILHYISNAPHPAGAKLFANWILTKEGSTSYGKNIKDNSRRVDVEAFEPAVIPPKGMDFVLLDLEELLPEIEKSQEIAKSVLN
ncbi:MAG: ABC transporter substrate-binding protein [Chloroflexota bacterium]